LELIQNIAIIFVSIFFEALPFLLLGALISSIIGIIMGFFLPACDCAVIPVAKRLIKKKVPNQCIL